jgi:hypothetical protein
MIALADARPQLAVDERAQADQRDPHVVYWIAAALAAAREPAKARASAVRAAAFHGIALEYGLARVKARALATS